MADTLTIDDIRKLFKKRMGMHPSRATIYNYIIQQGFPKNLGYGRPRQWVTAEVEQWFDTQLGQTPPAQD